MITILYDLKKTNTFLQACISFDLPETIFGGKLCVCPVQLCSCKEKEWCRFYLRNLKLRFSIYVWTWSSFHRYHISVNVICFNVNHYIYLFCLLPIHILCTTLFAFLTSGYFHWLPSQMWSVQCPSSRSSQHAPGSLGGHKPLPVRPTGSSGTVEAGTTLSL